MKNLTPKEIIILWFLPILLLLGFVAYSGLNMGVDYSSANVISMRITSEKSVNEVKKELQNIRQFSRIDVLEGGQFYIYYQNVSIDDLKAMEDDLTTAFGELEEFRVFIYNPTTLVLITDRIIYALYITMFIYLILIAYQLKGSGITREKLIWFLLTELLVAGSFTLILFLLLNSLEIFNIQITSSLIIYTLTTFVFGLFLNIFLTRDLFFKPASKLTPEVEESNDRFLYKYQKYYLSLGLLLLALFLIDTEYMPLVIIYILAVFYSMFLFVKVKPLLLNYLVTNSNKHNPFSSRKFFKKEW